MTDYKQLPDDMLVEFSLIGDERAFEELVARYEKPVMTAAVRITGNHYSAQDASQDAFVSAWIKLSTLSNGAKFRPWLMAIARNSARTLLARYRCAACDLPLDDGIVCDLPDDSSEADELREMVKALDAETREVLEMHYFEGYSVNEMAQKLGQPVGTIKWRLSEGRKKLRKGYGYEEEYDDNEAVVRRVMRQVENLKMWRFKERMTGFEKEYRRVLDNVDALDESVDKDRAMSDMSIMGFQWIDGVKHKPRLEKIKAMADKVHNEDVMASVAEVEFDFAISDFAAQNDEHEFDEDELTNSYRRMLLGLEDALVRYYAERGYTSAVIRLLRTLADKFDQNNYSSDGKRCLEKLAQIAPQGSFACHFARAALAEHERFEKMVAADIPDFTVFSICSRIVSKGGKLYQWDQGVWQFFRGDKYVLAPLLHPFWMLYDGIIADRSFKVGKPVVSSSGNTVTLIDDNATVETPAGLFEGCSAIALTHGNTGIVRTIYSCPGVGPVKITSSDFILRGHHVSFDKNGRCDNEALLVSYDAAFDGLIPRKGSRWDYEYHSDLGGLCVKYRTQVMESGKNDAVVVTHFCEDRDKAKTDSIAGDVDRIRTIIQNSMEIDDPAGKVSAILGRAAKRNLTPRERTILNAFTRAAKRDARLAANLSDPNAPVRGLWNLFDVYEIAEGDGCLTKSTGNSEWDLTFTPFLPSIEGQKLLHNEFINILADSTGFLWNDIWKPGYSENYMRDVYGMKDRELSFHFVKDGETVTVPAGTFENCVHIQFDMRGIGNLYTPYGYRGGWADYWFAPGVGVVQHFRLINATYDCYWQLTEYEGTGEGYFPCGDGLFRRYEPANLREGFISSLEITFVHEDGKIYMISDGEGAQKTENYRAAEKALIHSEPIDMEPWFETRESIISKILPMIVEADPAGFIAEGYPADEYKNEAEMIADNAMYYGDRDDVLTSVTNSTERILTYSWTKKKPDKKLIRSVANAAYDEYKKGDLQSTANVNCEELYYDRLTGEFDDLVARAKELLSENDCGARSQAVAILCPSREIYSAFIPDATADDQPEEDALIEEIASGENGSVLRIVCLRSDESVVPPCVRLIEKIVGISEYNRFAAAMIDSKVGFKRLGDLEAKKE